MTAPGAFQSSTILKNDSRARETHQRRLTHVGVDCAHHYERSQQDEKNNRDARASFSSAALVGVNAQRSEVRSFRGFRHSRSVNLPVISIMEY